MFRSFLATWRGTRFALVCQVEVFGLGTWPGYLLKGDKYRLRWALKNEAALLQVEAR